MKIFKIILKYFFIFIPAALATFIVTVARTDFLLNGQFISVDGVGIVGILYSLSVLLCGIFWKKNTIIVAGMFFFFASVVVLAVGLVSGIPICDLSNGVDALRCYP